jgi:hypothetical protein
LNVIRNLDIGDIGNVTRAVKDRQELYDETLEMSIGVVLLNYGDHLTQVRCTNGEWHGKKEDVPPRRGIPLCPNNHPLFEYPNKPHLALVEE